MSFFGALFAGVTLFSKGVSKGQDILTDRELKRRSRELGHNFYYDHKGITHDAKTGRAITYHTDPFTGHRLIQDAYTLNTIRDLTAEERLKEIQEAKERAKNEGSEYYEICKKGKACKVLGRNEWMKLESKFDWGNKGTFQFWKKDFAGRNIKEKEYSLEKLRYGGELGSYSETAIYRKDNNIDRYIIERFNDIEVYSSLETGLAIEVETKSKQRLIEIGYKEEDFINKINNVKRYEASKGFCKIPMSANI